MSIVQRWFAFLPLLFAVGFTFAGRATAVCVPAPPGLTAWWTGDGITNDVYNGFDASLVNGASYAPGLVGQAFVFDGIDDFVSAPHSPALNFGIDDFTVVFWVNADVISTSHVVLTKATYDEALQPAPLRGWAVYLRPFGELVDIQLSDAVAVQYAGSPVNSIDANAWFHVAIRRQAGNYFSTFVNGVLLAAGETELITDVDNQGPVVIGAFLSNQGYFKGRVDEVQIFAGRALSDAEIIAIHAAGSDGICAIVPACGNDRQEIGEECDDGNATAGDGCEPDCTLSCGNGVVTSVEECDDGNLTNGDGCDSDCSVTACGNGIITVETGEACDDGNLLSGDGCDANCTVTACGNGFTSRSTGEKCDDGNLTDGDGCEANCTTTPLDVVVPPGGTATTDPNDVGATPQYPKQLSIETATGGQVTIEDVTDTVVLDGIQFLGIAVQIEAPAESSAAPLVITLTIDASAIPAGIDTGQIQALRDRVPLLDCDAPSTAEPDPCLESLSVIAGGDVRLVMLTSHASLWQVGVRGLLKNELKCVSAMNGAGLKVTKAMAKSAATCLKQAHAGETADPQACFLADGSGKLNAALLKTLASDTSKCPSGAPFGYGGGSTVNVAAQAAATAVVGDVLGPDLTAATAVAGGEAGEACQSSMLKLAHKLFDTRNKLFLACAKGSLTGKTQLAVSGPQLAACFDEVEADGKGKLAKLVSKMKDALASTCADVDVSTVLPGTCFDGFRAATCLDERSKCRMCQLFDGMDALGFDCDSFDDGESNQSCP